MVQPRGLGPVTHSLMAVTCSIPIDDDLFGGSPAVASRRLLVLCGCCQAGTDVLLGVEEKDVQLGTEENDEAHHGGEADGDGHGGCPGVARRADVDRHEGQPDDAGGIPGEPVRYAGTLHAYMLNPMNFDSLKASGIFLVRTA